MLVDSTSGSGDSDKGLREEIARLREDNEDLRASAKWWLLLYEAAVGRANDFEDWLSSPDEIRRASALRFSMWQAHRDTQRQATDAPLPPRAASIARSTTDSHSPIS